MSEPIKNKKEPFDLLRTMSEKTCPSFEDEPWASKAKKIRPKSFDSYSEINLTAPLPAIVTAHPYIELYQKFLDSVPKACWVDEETEQD